MNYMTSPGNDEETANGSLFGTLPAAPTGKRTSRENRTRPEWDGRTPYGQVGSDGVLRSTRTELTHVDPPPQRSQDIDTPRQSSPNPEKVTSRKRKIDRMTAADKVIPNMREATKGKRRTKMTMPARRKQRMSAPSGHDQSGWENADGLDPEDPEFFLKLKERQLEASSSEESE